MFPKTFPPAFTGAPRNECISGWLGGRPTEAGSLAMSGIRRVLASVMSRPRIPRPTGRAPPGGGLPPRLDQQARPVLSRLRHVAATLPACLVPDEVRKRLPAGGSLLFLFVGPP